MNPSIIGYDTFLHDLKTRIRTAQTRAALAVNRELVLLYWQIGRDILVMQIESRLFQRQGKAIDNFAGTLPPAQSDLAQQTLKDPYIFDFLGLGNDAQEREIKRELVKLFSWNSAPASRSSDGRCIWKWRGKIFS